MKLKELLARTSLKAIGRRLGLDVRMVDGRLHIRELLPRPLWALRLSSKSCFCRAVEQTGMLTHRQMVHAAWRYRLGRSKDDAVIYWQIDQLGQVHDGKLMWYGPVTIPSASLPSSNSTPPPIKSSVKSTSSIIFSSPADIAEITEIL